MEFERDRQANAVSPIKAFWFKMRFEKGPFIQSSWKIKLGLLIWACSIM